MKSIIRTLALTTLVGVTSLLTATVREITSQQQFSALLNENSTALIVIDLYQDNCGPCKSIAPEFKKLSDEFNTVIFIKINLKTFDPYNTRTIPTFKLVKNKKVIATFVGGDALPQVKTAIIKHK